MMHVIHHIDDASEYILLSRVELTREFSSRRPVIVCSAGVISKTNASKVSIRIVVRLACERLLPGISSRTMELTEPAIVQMLYAVVGCRCAKYGFWSSRFRLVAKSHQIDVPFTPPDHLERNLLLELQRREITLG